VSTLLTDEARAWADRAYPVHTVSVTAVDIRRFATATGETDPIHFDTEAARAAGHPDIVAPPMFYVLLRVQPYHLRPRDELEPDGSPSDLQQAFIQYGAVQCGFCTPGMVLAGEALLNDNPKPTRMEIREAIAGNLCRCTGYQQIVDAIQQTAQSRQEKKTHA